MSPASDSGSVLSTARVIPFPAPEVFSAFENAGRLARWWGPDGFTNTFEHFEFRPGGKWVFTMHAPNGTDYANECQFREIDPGKRIVIEHVVKPWYRLTVTLTPQGNHTQLAWDQEFESREMADRMRALAATANEQNLDRLHSLLAEHSH